MIAVKNDISKLIADIAKIQETLIYMESKLNLILSETESRTEMKFVEDEQGAGKVVPKTLLDVWNQKSRKNINGRTNK